MASTYESIDVSAKVRKRKRNPENWQRNKRKKANVQGQSYITVRSKNKPRKQIGDPCNCKEKCFEKFTSEERQKVFEYFRAFEDKVAQDTYISGLIQVKNVRRQNNENGEDKGEKTIEISNKVLSKQRDNFFLYKIRFGTIEHHVCRTAFCSMFGIDKSRVYNIASHLAKKVGPYIDGRGKHNTRPNKMPESICKQINDHILSFPQRESHYSRNKTTRKYLSPDLNVRQMWKFYLEKYELNTFRLMESDQTVRPIVTYQYYHNYFVENFNLSFISPKSDTCKKCDILKTAIINCANENDKKYQQANLDMHQVEADQFFTDLNAKTILASKDPTVETICFDFQQNMPIPKLTTNEIFYSRQIWVYNLGFHVASTKQRYMFMYDETIAKKGSNDVISCLQYFVDNLLRKEVKVLYIFTDNCAGQNKNMLMVWFLQSLICNNILAKIVHHYPEVGHSFLPCDRDFAQIELRKRRKEIAYVPQDWYDMVKQCGKKFNVIKVTKEMIFNLKQHLELHFKKKICVGKQLFHVSKYKLFDYDTDHINSVKVSETHTFEDAIEFQVLKTKKRTCINMNAQRLYTDCLPLHSKKYDDVKKLVSKYIPLIHHDWYNKLKRGCENDGDEQDVL